MKHASILLDYYHCTYFLPLIGDMPDELEVSSASIAEPVYYPPGEDVGEDVVQAFQYFTPTIRSLLFDSGQPAGFLSDENIPLKPIREWRVPPEALAEWQLNLAPPAVSDDMQPDDPRGMNCVANVKSIALYRFFNGLCMLAFRVEPAALDIIRAMPQSSQDWLFSANSSLTLDDADSLTNTDPDLHQQLQKLQLESWLHFTRLSRQLYPTFTEQDDEAKIAHLTLSCADGRQVQAPAEALSRKLPAQIGDQLSPVVKHLIELFFEPRLCQSLYRSLKLFDDRLFISVAYGLAGGKPNTEVLNRIESLVAYTDRFSDTFSAMDGHAYTPSAIETDINDSALDLWRDLGARYFFNDIVNAYVSNGFFFRKYIAPKHIPLMYDRMLIQALFYQATLRLYDREITYSTERMLSKADDRRDHYRSRLQLQEFIRFTNQYWFRDLTNQMQGKRIGRLQQQGLELEQSYEQIESEIARTHDYLQTIAADKENSNGKFLTLAGVLLGLLALLPVYAELFAGSSLSGLAGGLLASFRWLATGLTIGFIGFMLTPYWLNNKRSNFWPPRRQ